MNEVITDIAAERARQRNSEGWSDEHDDQHVRGEMAIAAACYALTAAGNNSLAEELWPWDIEWFKPKDKRSDLIRAAALLTAEAERLDRIHEINNYRR